MSGDRRWWQSEGGLLLAGGLCITMAMWIRWPGFGGAGQRGLFLDDQWVAVLVRDASVLDVLRFDAPIPPGFLLIQQLIAAAWGGVGPDREWVLQLLPEAAGLAVIPLVGWVVWRMTENVAGAALTMALAAVNETLALYGHRAKPFTTDALIVAGLAALAVEVMRNGGDRAKTHQVGRKTGEAGLGTGADPGAAETASRGGSSAAEADQRQRAAWIALVLLASAAPAVSFVSVPAGGAIIAGVAIARWWERSLEPRFWLGLSAYTLIVTLWFIIVLHGHDNAALSDYWAKHYLPALWDGGAWMTFLQGPWRWWLAGAGLPLWGGLIGWLCVVAWLAVVHEASWRWLGLAMAGLSFEMIVLAGLQKYPIGGGRTDLYIYPLIWITLGLGATWVIKRWPRTKPAVIGLSMLIALWVVLGGRQYGYPPRGDRMVVERMVETWAGDGREVALIYPWSSWAVGWYSPWNGELVDVSDSTNGFIVSVRDEAIWSLREAPEGILFLEDPMVIGKQVAEALAGRPERVHVLATEANKVALRSLLDDVAAAGYTPVDRLDGGGAASWILFRRNE